MVISHDHRFLNNVCSHILDVDYEKLVSDPEQQIRRVLDFLDLDFDPSVLEFHRSDRVTFTASNDQVRKPVYGTSVGRWRHYAEHLSPLRDMLEADEDDA